MPCETFVVMLVVDWVLRQVRQDVAVKKHRPQAFHILLCGRSGRGRGNGEGGKEDVIRPSGAPGSRTASAP